MKPCRALKRANRLRFGFKKLRKGVRYQIRYVRVDESPDQGALNHGPVAQPGRAPASKISRMVKLLIRWSRVRKTNEAGKTGSLVRPIYSIDNQHRWGEYSTPFY